MSVNVENPKETITTTTKKSPGIRDCRKVTEDKVNILKSITFLFTDNKQIEFARIAFQHLLACIRPLESKSTCAF